MLIGFNVVQYKEAVKDCAGNWICEGMYVVESAVPFDSCRKGWVTKVVDEHYGKGRIQVLLDGVSITTDFEPSQNWVKSPY